MANEQNSVIGINGYPEQILCNGIISLTIMILLQTTAFVLSRRLFWSQDEEFGGKQKKNLWDEVEVRLQYVLNFGQGINFKIRMQSRDRKIIWSIPSSFI